MENTIYARPFVEGTYHNEELMFILKHGYKKADDWCIQYNETFYHRNRSRKSLISAMYRLRNQDIGDAYSDPELEYLKNARDGEVIDITREFNEIFPDRKRCELGISYQLERIRDCRPHRSSEMTWSPEELEILDASMDLETSEDAIQRALPTRRSVKAIKQALHKARRERKAARQRQGWIEDEIDALNRARQTHTARIDIVNMFRLSFPSRTKKAIEHKLRDLESLGDSWEAPEVSWLCENVLYFCSEFSLFKKYEETFPEATKKSLVNLKRAMDKYGLTRPYKSLWTREELDWVEAARSRGSSPKRLYAQYVDQFPQKRRTPRAFATAIDRHRERKQIFPHTSMIQLAPVLLDSSPRQTASSESIPLIDGTVAVVALSAPDRTEAEGPSSSEEWIDLVTFEDFGQQVGEAVAFPEAEGPSSTEEWIDLVTFEAVAFPEGEQSFSSTEAQEELVADPSPALRDQDVLLTSNPYHNDVGLGEDNTSDWADIESSIWDRVWHLN